MKLFFTVILIFWSLFSYSQKSQGVFPVKDGKVVYEHVDSSAVGTAAALYNRAKLWVANSFKDSKSVIQIDDKETSTIVGKGNFEVVQTMTPYIIRFSFEINTKENKYRIRFYDITSTQDTQMGREKTAESLNKASGFGNVKEKINKRFESLLADVRAFMVKQGNSDF